MRSMRWLVLALVAGCASNTAQKTNLEGSIECGGMTCGSGQICFSQDSGSQCDVNLDAGIGPYQQFGWTCGSLPAECDGVTRDCFTSQWDVVSADGRYVDHLCI